MIEFFQRISVGLLGTAILLLSFVLLAKPESLFTFVEGNRDRFPIVRALNPLARFNSASLSRVTAVGMGIISLLMGLLLLIVCIFGRAA